MGGSISREGEGSEQMGKIWELSRGL